VDKKLPARPHLDHLRRQAKVLLKELTDGDGPAARTFIEHLPEARRMTPSAVRAAGFRLADAQSVVARQTGFASWPALSRHVQQLRALEGEWRFASLEIDGTPLPGEALAQSRLLIDGDRFRTESPEATYEGTFVIDVEAAPPTIDIEFVEGPEAGNQCHGLYELAGDGDHLTLCLGLVGASRPVAFTTRPGSGHALERLRRVSAARPANVTGGSGASAASEEQGSRAARKNYSERPPRSSEDREDASWSAGAMTPLLRRLEGEWVPVHLVRDGKTMPDQWLAFGFRKSVGDEVTVIFGGQVMVHAKMRIDETVTPIAVDYLNLAGHQGDTVSRGIMEWVGDDVRFLMAAPGHPRPADFNVPLAKGTLSQWRRKP
jgi:uncharacterized protein (TIGR03067 family)